MLIALSLGHSSALNTDTVDGCPWGTYIIGENTNTCRYRYIHVVDGTHTVPEQRTLLTKIKFVLGHNSNHLICPTKS